MKHRLKSLDWNIILTILFLCSFVAYAAHPHYICADEEREFINCPERASIVCGIFAENVRLTFTNRCQACSHRELVKFIVPISCKELTLEMTICDPITKSKSQCGYYQVCGRDYGGNYQTYENSCDACSNENVVYFNSNSCKEQ